LGHSLSPLPRHFVRSMLYNYLNRPPKYLPLNLHNNIVSLINRTLPNAPFNYRGNILGGFADSADGDDSFYNDLNLESLDALTTPIGALTSDPSTPPPVVPPNSTRVAANCNRDGRKRQRGTSTIMLGSWMIPRNRIVALAWTSACMR